MTVLGVHDECVTFPVRGVHLISKMAWVCRGLFRKILKGGGGGGGGGKSTLEDIWGRGEGAQSFQGMAYTPCPH